jgi:hypothetical protein
MCSAAEMVLYGRLIVMLLQMVQRIRHIRSWSDYAQLVSDAAGVLYHKDAIRLGRILRRKLPQFS